MATINTSDLTQASGVTTSTDGKYTVTGTGVFDDLMEAVNAHLSAQFSLGRLTGTDYATVYLGAIQSSLQNSVQFVLGKQQADKQADLLTKQILTEEKKTLDVVSGTTVRNAQSSQDLLNKASQKSLIDKQTLTEVKKTLDVVSTTTVRDTQSAKDILVKSAQVTSMTKEDVVKDKQAIDITNQTTNRTAAQTTNETTAVKQRLLVSTQTSQVASQTISGIQTSDADLAVKRQQIINEHFQNGMEVNEYIWEIEYKLNLGKTYTYVTIENLTENDVIALMTADPHNSAYPEVNTVTLNQTNNLQHAGKSTAASIIAKTQEERDLLKQKRVTEHAQTLTEVIGSTIATGSVMGKQSELFTQQAEGFKNDAKNAFNKNMADIIKMQINTAGDFNASKYIDVGHLLDVFPSDPNVTPST
jgi:hypothetical protein